MTELMVDKAKQLVAMMKNASNANGIFSRAPHSISRAALAMLSLAEKPGSDPDDRLARAAIAIGMHPASAAEGVRNLFSGMTLDALATLRETALRPIGNSIPRTPRLVFHLAAGNLFVSTLESLIHAQLLGCANIVRCSSGEQQFTALWLDVLKEVDPEMAAATAWGWWPHDELEITRNVAREADVMVAFGGDETIANLATVTAPGTRFIGHGSRWSYALLSASDLASETVARERSEALAYDLAVYDQQGCLSPQTVFVPSRASITPQKFAQLLAESLRTLEKDLPRRKLPLEALAAQARWRDEIALHAVMNNATSTPVPSRPADDFLITLRDARFHATTSPPTDRTADIFIYDSEEEVTSALLCRRGRIGCLGAGEPSEWQSLANDLRSPRLCKLGTMQRPPWGWAHDGRPPLMDLLDFQSD